MAAVPHSTSPSLLLSLSFKALVVDRHSPVLLLTHPPHPTAIMMYLFKLALAALAVSGGKRLTLLAPCPAKSAL